MTSTTATTNVNGKRPATNNFQTAVFSGLEQDATPSTNVVASAARGTMRFGENGCPEYTDQGVGSDLMALSQLVRGGDPTTLCQSLLKGDVPRDVSDLMILLFVTRNTRGGKGEKDLAFQMFLAIWKRYPNTAKQLLKLFPHYGYWKDLLLLAEKAKSDMAETILNEAIALMKEQLQKDMEAVAQYERELADSMDAEEVDKLKKKGPSISLLAKWLPRENSSFDKKLKFVRRFTRASTSDAWQSNSKAEYRKTVVKLTAFLELPEVYLSAQRADEINFHKLASKATFKLSKAMLNEGKKRSEDPKRIRLAELFVQHMSKKGLKGGQVMPHEIVEEVLKGNVSPLREAVLTAQWKDLWKGVVDQVKAKAEEEGLEFDPTKMVPLSDVSGSMSGTPMMVSIALGIGLSEITHPAFQNMILTFESKPRWHKLNPKDSIVQKVHSLSRAPWGGSTNFEAAYDLILDVCLKNRLAREDVPTLIVFSDMQFNSAAGCYNTGKTMHQTISAKFAQVAHTLRWKDSDPTAMVYWNLRNTGGHPVEKGTEGAVMLSGFSPSLLKLVMNGEALKEEVVEVVDADGKVHTEKIRVTPEQVLRKMLDDSLYDPVRLVLAESKEGALGDYELLQDASVSGPNDDGFELI